MFENVSSQMQQGWTMWKKAWDDHQTRVTGLFEEVNKLEQKNVEQLASTLDEMAKLSKDNFAYVTQLSAEWRKLSLEAAKKATSFVSQQG